MREYLLTALVTAAVTYLLVPLVRRFALRIGAAPEIRERDVHTTPTPRLGGLAMFAGFVVGLLVASHLPYVGQVIAQEQIMLPLLAASGLIVVTGFLDDWWGMDPFVKLAGQIGAAGLMVYFGMSLTSIPVPGGAGYNLDSTLQAVVTILIVVISINAVNFVDGLDGLAAGIVAIAGMATFAYSIALSWDIQDTRINSTAVITALLIGMCAGFLPHNFHPAKIFMGDTGAMLLGLVLAASMVKVTPIDPSILPDLNRFPVILPMLVPVAVLVPPLADFLMAVVRRMSYGKSPFAPDRGHLHHRLLDTGHSQRSAVLILYAWTFLFAFTVVGLSIFGVALIVFPFTVVFAIAVLMLMWLPKWRSRKGRGTAAAGERPGPGGGGPSAAPATAGAPAAAADRPAPVPPAANTPASRPEASGERPGGAPGEASGGSAAAPGGPVASGGAPGDGGAAAPADPFAGVRRPSLAERFALEQAAETQELSPINPLRARRIPGGHPYGTAPGERPRTGLAEAWPGPDKPADLHRSTGQGPTGRGRSGPDGGMFAGN